MWPQERGDKMRNNHHTRSHLQLARLGMPAHLPQRTLPLDQGRPASLRGSGLLRTKPSSG
jgi:hypothetical protein